MLQSLTGFIQVGVDILKTTVSAKTKSILAQLGDVVNQDIDADNAEWWQHVGFVSRPPKPLAGKKACQGVVVRKGDHDVVIASKDERGQELAGTLADGETCLYAPGSDGASQARVLLKDNGSINLYTTNGNTSGGPGMGIFINPDDDSISIVNSEGFGIVIKPDGVYITARDSALSLKASGEASLVGKGQTQVDGSTIVLGSTAVPVVNAVLVGVTGMSGAASSKVLAQLA